MKKRTISSLYGLLLLLSFPVYVAAQESGIVRAIQINYSIPLLDENRTKFLNDQDSVRIYYYQDLVLHELYYMQYDSVTYENREFNAYDPKRRCFWLVYEKDSTYGFSFDEEQKEKAIWGKVDSMLSKNGVMDFQLSKLFDSGLVRKLSSSRQPETGDLKEVYVSKDSAYRSQDTVYFTFTSQLTDIPYSFDKKLDSLKKMRLCHIRTVTGGEYLKEYGLTISGSAVAVIDLKRVHVEHKEYENVINYVARYRYLKKSIR